ncbi:MAG: alkaline phosphatase family protein [Bacteroidota bacterium]|nr:alkaline phosphatase family protein [Bacteroidota bacterium]
MKKIFTLMLVAFVTLAATASQTRKVLIIGIDGVRADALQAANTPNIDNLIATGFSAFNSWHIGITVSGPSWSTIMTGVEYGKHGVTSNSYSGSNYNNYPYFPTRAKTCLPNLYAVQIVQWAPMSDNVYNDGWDQKIKVCDGCGANSVSSAQTQLANSNLDVLFVYFDECDLAGHSTGFSTSNPLYINAIQTVDGHVGSIMTALHNRPNYANEDWVVLLTTDHGGTGTGHGGNSASERKIWWIGSGNNVSPKQMGTITDPGSFATSNYNATVGLNNPSQWDIAETALDHLFRGTGCNPKNPAWGLDGHSWLDSLHTEVVTDVKTNTKSEFSYKFFPNPTTDISSFWFENEANEEVSYKITDLLGNVIEEKKNVATINKNKLNISFCNISKGTYFVTLNVGNKVKTNKIIVE